MNTSELRNFIKKTPCILGEGAVIERLRRATNFELDPHIVNSAFIYDEYKRAALERIYRGYMDTGYEFNLPLVLSTPTWRANQSRIKDAGFEAYDVNADNYRFLDALRKSYGDYGEKIIICGLMSCRGDAYFPGDGLSFEDAREFHRWQAEKLAGAGVDFILAATLPALDEAKGLAFALAGTEIPYIISFIARPEGTILEGTPLKTAIAEIDAAVSLKPLAYMINCTHASFVKAALMHETNSSPVVRERIIGLFANTAALSPEELNNSTELVEEDPEIFGKTVAELNKSLGFKILGGCCGTDDRHIRALASELVKGESTPGFLITASK